MTVQWYALAMVLVITVITGLLWRWTQGRVRVGVSGPRDGRDADDGGWRQEVEALGADLGPRATFLQLSAQVCSACRSTARVVGTLAAAEPGVVHLEVEVDERPDLVRRARVLRTPTVLVLDARGHEVARASGSMSPAGARDALDAVDRAAARRGDAPQDTPPRRTT